MTIVTDIMDDRPDYASNEKRPVGVVGEVRLTEQQLRARRARSVAIALALGAFVVLIFLVTIVRLGPAALTGAF